MFVQSAHALTTSADALTLHGLAHATLFFAERPHRVVGPLRSATFIAQWGAGDNSFAVDPPNAVVSFLAAGDAVPEDVTLVLRDPQLRGDTLTDTIEVLDGTLPAQAGPCSLFIDPLGRPLSPVSVAGLQRRDRRDDRRERRW